VNLSKLAKILKNDDIILAVGLVVIVCMMIIPLPAFLLDLLLTVNIALAVIILLVCLYTKEPLEYSSFPTVLLIATLFRLGLNVSSTRLILLQGEAGNVIRSFGEFVVGGNYVVGFIIFVILVLINFMVITGGATRIAEVSARFTLDKMPGKQLSIDADLNAGIIDEEQAKERRKKLERETDFYGTMDGASKFVKGDATAGIIITIINIVGGLIIGMVQLHLDIMTALSTYTILTVGDGLVSQVPALLISTATGLIVSRATGKEESLSKDIDTEMFSDPRILGVLSGLLMTLGIVPGMPTVPFVMIGTLTAVTAFFKSRTKNEIQKEQEVKEQQAEINKKIEAKKDSKGSKESIMKLLNVETIEIEVGYRLVPLLNIEMGGDLLERIAQIRRQTALDLGIILPSVRVRDNLQLAPNTYQIKLKGVAIEMGEIYPERSLAMNAGGDAEDYGITGIHAIEPAFGLPALWIEDSIKDDAEIAGFTVVSPSAVISTHLTEVIKKNAAEILSRADVQQLVNNLKQDVSEEYITDIMKDLSIADIQIVMQNLLRERVPVRDLKTILETMSVHIKINRSYEYLTEQVRLALARYICKQNLADSGELLAVTISPDVEMAIAKGVTPDGNGLVLDPGFSNRLIGAINDELTKALNATANQPVILCSAIIRPAFSKYLAVKLPQIAIMSYNEITRNTKVKSVGLVRVQVNNNNVR